MGRAVQVQKQDQAGGPAEEAGVRHRHRKFSQEPEHLSLKAGVVEGHPTTKSSPAGTRIDLDTSKAGSYLAELCWRIIREVQTLPVMDRAVTVCEVPALADLQMYLESERDKGA